AAGTAATGATTPRKAARIHARGLVCGYQRAAVALGQDADALHVALGFAVWRHAVVLVDRALAGVVAGRGEGQVAVEALQQPGQVLHAALDVLPRVERVADAEPLRRRRHQLHQALRADARQRVGVEGRFGVDDRPHDGLFHAVLLGRPADFVGIGRG